MIAYCGGWVEREGKCGYAPLIAGIDENWPVCGRLVCPECGYCSDECHAGRAGKRG